MIDKLYPARWDPDGADDSGLLYCHGADYAFWIDPEAEDWWGPELATAINDAHDLRDLVQQAQQRLVGLHNDPHVKPPVTETELDGWHSRARAALEVMR